MTGLMGYNGTKAVKTMVPLKCVSSFWTTLEKPLSNCEINLILTWLRNLLDLVLLRIKQLHLQELMESFMFQL